MTTDQLKVLHYPTMSITEDEKRMLLQVRKHITMEHPYICCNLGDVFGYEVVTLTRKIEHEVGYSLLCWISLNNNVHIVDLVPVRDELRRIWIDKLTSQ